MGSLLRNNRVLAVKPFIISLVLGNIGLAQNQKLGVVLDSATRKPVALVDVFNRIDNTITNAEGAYFILTDGDSLSFQKIGYAKTVVPFSKLEDTLLLPPSPMELDEVVLIQPKSLWNRVRDSLRSNYQLTPFKERFFLRCVLRKNGEIVRIQDISGKLKRKTMFYNQDMEANQSDFEFEISHMRKVGIEKDEKDVYFTSFSLADILFETIRMNATGPGFELTEQLFENERRARIVFQSDTTFAGLNTRGHYIINTDNNAIESFEVKTTIDRDNYFKNGPIRSRTIARDQKAFFSKSEKEGRYFQSISTMLFTIEITHTKKDFRYRYTSEYILKTYDHNGKFKFSKNVNSKKDVFKLKHPYDEHFWNNQNDLLLTSEMEAFIEKMAKGNTKFKVRSNLIR
ncbi:MAG: hypothetical protein AAF634_18220 [Bacteroidota bacterium]